MTRRTRTRKKKKQQQEQKKKKEKKRKKEGNSPDSLINLASKEDDCCEREPCSLIVICMLGDSTAQLHSKAY